jgi:hypothetical protein
MTGDLRFDFWWEQIFFFSANTSCLALGLSTAHYAVANHHLELRLRIHETIHP